MLKLIKELVKDEKALNMLMVSLISADSLITVEACDSALRILEGIDKAISTDDFKNEEKKEYLKMFVDKGYQIAEKTKEELISLKD